MDQSSIVQMIEYMKSPDSVDQVWKLDTILQQCEMLAEHINAYVQTDKVRDYQMLNEHSTPHEHNGTQMLPPHHLYQHLNELQKMLVNFIQTWEPIVDQLGIPQFGSAKGMITMADDFDAPLEDFREYME